MSGWLCVYLCGVAMERNRDPGCLPGFQLGHPVGWRSHPDMKIQNKEDLAFQLVRFGCANFERSMP